MSEPPVTMLRSRRTCCACIGALALVLATSACGIPTDEQPRAISPSSTTVPNAEAPNAVDPNSTDGIEETVYLVEATATDNPDGERLAPQTVRVPHSTDVAQLAKSTLEQLIALPSDRGLTNAVPSGTRILSTRLSEDGTELTIDLSEDFNDVQQSLQRRAFAQLVFSATGVTPASITRVRFEIDGVPRAAATGNDVTPAAGDSVTRADYPSFESTMASTTVEVGDN